MNTTFKNTTGKTGLAEPLARQTTSLAGQMQALDKTPCNTHAPQLNPKSQATSDSKARRHILIVEDDTQVSTALSRAVEALGFTTAVAHSLSTARTLMTECVPDVVLLDLGLPDGNGLEFMLEARAQPHTRFVVITGNQSQDAAVESLRADVDDYLVKPVSLSELRATIARSVAKQEHDEQAVSNAISQASEETLVTALVGKSFWQIEKELLFATLQSCGGNKAMTAKTLGISLKTLYNRLHAYS